MVFTAIVFVLTSGCAWRHLPPGFGVAVPTAHRRFTEWTEAGLWRQLHDEVLDELGGQGMIDGPPLGAGQRGDRVQNRT
ncbi:transposase [Amycolatopsis mediterranei S699]|uniref:Transposase n=2 Tax=Amycolatopsis mediterranei TaxID=33910 RepID=A0A0H3DCS0_AMYMU|nr:transposase [Amycolatopsis mediterranei U32]AEK44281.1 transposase [Amycolatopsis mediterranei S699]AFO79145.1 transposase [Amycolatopsis mediterranei S699]AGT86273.1 transposase [Amycolatopsis mediterranei RB]